MYIVFSVTIIGRTMSLSVSDLVISVVAFPLLSAKFNPFKIDLLDCITRFAICYLNCVTSTSVV